MNTTLCRTHGLKSGACRRPETERQGLPMRPSHDSVRRSESSLHTVGPPVLLNSIIGTPGGRYTRLVTPLRAPFAAPIAPSYRGEDLSTTLLRDTSPVPLPSEQCVRVEACACRSTAARGWHCDEGCARPRRARHGSARRAYQRQLSRHGNAYPGSSSEPGRRRRDATAAHSTSSARCPALSPAARSDGRRLARCSAPWPQTEERPRGVCDVRCGV